MRGAVGKVGDTVRGVVGSAGDRVKTAMRKVAGATADTVDDVTEVVDADGTGRHFDAATGKFMDAVANLYDAAVGDAADAVGRHYDAATGKFMDAAGNLYDATDDFVDAAGNHYDAATGKFMDAAGNLYDNAVGSVHTA